MFEGFADEGDDLTLLFQVEDGSGNPKEPDAAPTYRVYGRNGVVASGTGSASSFESGSVNGASNASPIVISTPTAHGVSTGQPVTVANVGGNAAANGNFRATNVDSTHFSLQGSTGSGGYTTGGTWRTTGLYKVALTGSVLSSLEAGQTYTVVLTYAISSVVKTKTATFTVR